MKMKLPNFPLFNMVIRRSSSKKKINQDEIFLTLLSLPYVVKLPTVNGKFHVKKEKGVFFLKQRVHDAFGFTIITKPDKVYQIQEINDSMIRRLLILTLENLDNRKALIYVNYKMRDKLEYYSLLQKVHARKIKQNFAERLFLPCGENTATGVVDETLSCAQEYKDEGLITKGNDGKEVIKPDLLGFATVNIRTNEGHMIIYGAKRVLESL